MGKDLPLLRRALQSEEHTPTFALLKGWRNYLCLSRLHQAVASQRTLLEQEKLDELVGIAEWAGHTGDGTLSDLPVTPSSEVWDEVSAEADLCTRLKCTHFDKCFLFRARRRAAEAEKLAREVLKNPPLAVRAIVETRRSALEEIDVRAYALRPRGLHLTEDFRESARAFVEKRKPGFKNR